MADNAQSPSNMQLALAISNPRYAAQQAAIAQQQALAQQLMQDGSEKDDYAKLANPGGFVVPISPWAAAGKAIQKTAGSYLNARAIGDQLKAYETLGAGATSPSGAAGTPGQADLFNSRDILANMVNPEGYKADLALRNAGPLKAAEIAQTPQNMNGHIGFVTPPGLAPKSQPVTVAPPTPVTQANLPPVASGAPAEQPIAAPMGTPTPSAPVVLRGPKTDFNNPVEVKGNEKYNETTNAFYGDLSNKLQQASIDSNSKIGDYRQLSDLLEGIDTGKFEGNINEVKKLAARFGIDMPEDVGPVEAAKAISVKLALQSRTDGGNNLMPGAVSNYEDELLQSMKPGIENSTAGRKLMVDFAVRKLKRDQQIADLSSDYEDRNGKLDRGITKEVKNFVAKNPLYKEGEFEAMRDEAQKAQESVQSGGGKLSPDEQKELDTLRARFKK